VIFDSHTHLYWRSFDKDRAETLARARDAGVERMMVIGTDVATSRAALELAHSDPHIWASVGIHPNDLGTEGASADDLAAIVELAGDERCVAIGETGLDYYWDRVPAAVQCEGFRWHLELSAATNKPVVVHARDAHEDTARLLTEAVDGEHPGGVMHCFTMGAAEVTAYTALDLYISFSGVVTYPKNDDNRAAAKLVETDRLLVETDSPFLPPQPWRGKRNEPAYVAHVVERLAELRGITPDELAASTATNAARLFRLPT
jgi:TatD DNase family protein